MDLRLYDLREDDFDVIISLGNSVHGNNYVNHDELDQIYRKSCTQGLCCSKVMYDRPRDVGKLIGFRLTYAPGQWDYISDIQCSSEEWGESPEKVCYFKSITIDSDYRGLGIGPYLLDVSIQTVKRQGGVAGVTHIWIKSPGTNPFKYFAKAGGELLWVWPDRWKQDPEGGGYQCRLCCKTGVLRPCGCLAAEMILHFGETRNE